jgi:DNA-binding transcriptional LysR family regulator
MGTQAEIGNLELALLRTFLAVVDEGSIGRAAASVDMTQPAVSQQILRLEKIIGQRLFARERDGVTLTRHGKLLVPYANRAVELNEETLKQLREESARGLIALGASPDVALAGLLPALKRLQSIYPELELRFLVTAAEKLDPLLKTGELDLVITSAKVMTGTPRATWSVPLQWAAAEDVCVDKSRLLPLVLFEEPCIWQDKMLESFRSAGWAWRVSFESSSLDAILTATQSGLGIAALSIEAIQKIELAIVSNAGLPHAPVVEFGMFAGTALSNHARTVLEVAMASLATAGCNY